MIRNKNNQSIALFIHYFTEEYIPYTVEKYVFELANHFDEIVIYTNERELTSNPFINQSAIQLKFVKNEGYDFGMFYKFFHSIDIDKYHQIACVNDSNILLTSLNVIKEIKEDQSVDFWGLIDSYQKPRFSNHDKNYHIQSHFIVFNQAAIQELKTYFNGIKIEEYYNENNAKLLRRKVINNWEIGISQHFIKKGLKAKSLFCSRTISLQHGLPLGKNLTFKLARKLIEMGYPIVKRKALIEPSWFKKIITTNLRLNKIIRQTLNHQTEYNRFKSDIKLYRNQYLKQKRDRVCKKLYKKIFKRN